MQKFLKYMQQVFSPYILVGYVTYSVYPGHMGTVTCLQVKHTQPTAKGQNVAYVYRTLYNTNHTTLLRAVRACIGHQQATIKYYNFACCKTGLGYCHCHGLGVSV